MEEYNIQIHLFLDTCPQNAVYKLTLIVFKHVLLLLYSVSWIWHISYILPTLRPSGRIIVHSAAMNAPDPVSWGPHVLLHGACPGAEAWRHKVWLSSTLLHKVKLFSKVTDCTGIYPIPGRTRDFLCSIYSSWLHHIFNLFAVRDYKYPHCQFRPTELYSILDTRSDQSTIMSYEMAYTYV